jgi:CRP-like cAMP-binding protein
MYDESNFVEVKQLTSGQSFGEMALKNFNNSTRAATIVCLSDCDLVVLSRSDYKKILEKIDDKILEFDLKFLKAMPYFSKWS